VAAWFVSERTREPVPLSRTHSPRVSEVPYLAPDFTFTSFSTPPACPTPTPPHFPKTQLPNRHRGFSCSPRLQRVRCVTIPTNTHSTDVPILLP
jgi:hypothetical protein